MWILAAVLIACGQGCIEYKNTCACDPPAEKTVQTFQPSDEKPRRGKQPAWETGEVRADPGIRAKETVASENYKAEKEQR